MGHKMRMVWQAGKSARKGWYSRGAGRAAQQGSGPLVGRRRQRTREGCVGQLRTQLEGGYTGQGGSSGGAQGPRDRMGVAKATSGARGLQLSECRRALNQIQGGLLLRAGGPGATNRPPSIRSRWHFRTGRWSGRQGPQPQLAHVLLLLVLACEGDNVGLHGPPDASVSRTARAAARARHIEQAEQGSDRAASTRGYLPLRRQSVVAGGAHQHVQEEVHLVHGGLLQQQSHHTECLGHAARDCGKGPARNSLPSLAPPWASGAASSEAAPETCHPSCCCRSCSRLRGWSTCCRRPCSATHGEALSQTTCHVDNPSPPRVLERLKQAQTAEPGGAPAGPRGQW